MKRILTLFLAGLLIVGILAAAGCGNKSSETGSQTSTQTGSQTDSTGLTKENPLKVDKEAGTVSFLAKVNGKYLYEPTRHGVVSENGKNGEKPIFKAFAEPEPFYNALVEIGAKPGNNMTMENKDKTNVAGDALDVTVTWAGANKEYKFDEVIKDSNGKPIDIRFGGNLKNAGEYKTGCLICLDSCPVGITSNSAYTFGAVEDRNEVGFTGNKDILPADGTLVEIKVKLKK